MPRRRAARRGRCRRRRRAPWSARRPAPRRRSCSIWLLVSRSAASAASARRDSAATLSASDLRRALGRVDAAEHHRIGDRRARRGLRAFEPGEPRGEVVDRLGIDAGRRRPGGQIVQLLFDRGEPRAQIRRRIVAARECADQPQQQDHSEAADHAGDASACARRRSGIDAKAGGVRTAALRRRRRLLAADAAGSNAARSTAGTRRVGVMRRIVGGASGGAKRGFRRRRIGWRRRRSLGRRLRHGGSGGTSVAGRSITVGGRRRRAPGDPGGRFSFAMPVILDDSTQRLWRDQSEQARLVGLRAPRECASAPASRSGSAARADRQ